MDVVLLNAEKLEIALNCADMQKLDLSYEEMDYSDEQTRKTLVALLEYAKTTANFHPRGAKLLVEVFPRADGGCVLHFTSLGSRFRSYPSHLALEPVVFEFSDADTLLEASVKTFARYSHRIYKSSLYRYREQYRLVVYPLDYSDQLSVYFLSEFARKVGQGEILAAYVEEHGELIIADNALDTLSEYF